MTPPTKPAIGDRITVGLIHKAAGELESLVNASGMSKTDIVNRAISLYSFVTTHIEAGDQLLIRDAKTNEVERIRLV